MPAHHNLDTYLAAYIEAAGITVDKKAPLFRTAVRRTQALTRKRMAQADVYRMIKRRAKDAGIQTAIGCHTLRATGITAYLTNGGKLEVAGADGRARVRPYHRSLRSSWGGDLAGRG